VEWDRLRQLRRDRLARTARTKKIIARERYRKLMAELSGSTREAFLEFGYLSVRVLRGVWVAKH